jgi:hypothetical protein
VLLTAILLLCMQTDWDKMRDIAAKMEHQIELLTDAVDELKNVSKSTQVNRHCQ